MLRGSGHWQGLNIGGGGNNKKGNIKWIIIRK